MTDKQRAVLGVVTTLCLAVAPAPAADGPTVIVEAVYPGANAAVLADTVAAPVEQQVNGVEGSLHLRSRCTNDGKYTLAVAFGPGTDADKARVAVRKRVDRALPTLPEAVKQAGLTVREEWPGPLLIACLFSPDGSRPLFLANYATIQIRDELARVPGVARVALVGHGDYSIRVWLDPDKLLARALTAGEVVEALRNQNLAATTARPGKGEKGKDAEVEVSVEHQGRLSEPEQLGEVILKTDGHGRVVRLRDVARVELGANTPPREATFDGQPAVLVCVVPARRARPEEVRAGVRDMLRKLCRMLPPGLDLTWPFDFTRAAGAPDYLLLDLTLPAEASPQRVSVALRRCEAWARRAPGVRHTLALPENPFDLFGNGPAVLLSLDPGRENKAQLRKRLHSFLEEAADMVVRLREPRWAGGSWSWGYPVELAVHGPEAAKVRQFAEELAGRLGDSKKMTDVAADPASRPRRQLSFDIDRRKAADMGVSLTDISNTLEATVGAPLAEFNRPGRTWKVVVQAGPGPGDRAQDLAALKVRNSRGEMVPLGALAAVRQVEGPAALDRLDLEAMVSVTANPAGGAGAAEVRKLCEDVAADVRKELRLPRKYRVTWLRELPAKR
jgi:multidrug efflux pump subunit AcrB